MTTEITAHACVAQQKNIHKDKGAGSIPGSLIFVKLFCYILNPLEYILFVIANCATIPAQFCRYINLIPLINDTPPCDQFIVCMECCLFNNSFQLRAQELIQRIRQFHSCAHSLTSFFPVIPSASKTDTASCTSAAG
nr:MAG TPA: hypothetical protein [Caudoviricetes sp.]